MDAQEIIDFIANAPKKTPIKAYVRAREGARLDLSAAEHAFGAGDAVVFGDWSELGPALAAQADKIDDLVVECGPAQLRACRCWTSRASTPGSSPAPSSATGWRSATAPSS